MSIIKLYIENLGLWPDWGVGPDDHGFNTKDIPGAENLLKEPSYIQF
jgi:hypothetical protein